MIDEVIHHRELPALIQPLFPTCPHFEYAIFLTKQLFQDAFDSLLGSTETGLTLEGIELEATSRILEERLRSSPRQGTGLKREP